MNAAVLMFSACLAGADPAPVASPPVGPATVAPAAPAAAAPVPGYPGYPGSPGGYGSDSCGKASVCGDCCDKAKKCCLIDKIKAKLCCFKKCDYDKCDNCKHEKHESCDKGDQCGKSWCDKCGKGWCDKWGKGWCDKCNKCDKGPEIVYTQPVCPPKDCGKDCCLKGACCDKYKDCCPKQACCKADPCHEKSWCDKVCWKPGYFLHKCKAKLCGGCCDKDDGCHGGCGTAATPNACGSTVIVPGTPVAPEAPKAMPEAPKAAPEAPKAAPAPATIPPAVVPSKPADPKRIPEKVGTLYPPERSDVSPAGLKTKTIDLGPSPF